MTIKIENGLICTDLYRKETDKPSALLPSSAHPGHITQNIIYSMAFRMLRICSKEECFENRLKELKNDFLKPRNFKPKMIDREFEKIRSFPGQNFAEKRSKALEKVKREPKHQGRTIAPVDFNPHLPKVSQVFQKQHKAMVFNAPHLAEMFPSPPMPAYRQPHNLKKIICSSKLFPIERSKRLQRGAHKNAPGWRKCGKPCKVCPFTLDNTKSVTGTASGVTHDIKESVSCDTANCIYYWRCLKPNCEDFPNCEYIGKTTRPFKDRLAEHRDYPKRDVTTEPSGKHFTKSGHNVSDLKGLVLEKVRSNDPYILKSREHMLIKKFDSYRNGLNQEP